MHPTEPDAADTVVGTAEDILRRAAAVPAHASFPTVDALTAGLEQMRRDHPDLMRVQRIGTSRLGEPILMHTIVGGSASALVVGGVHPNEPIGSLTILHLAGQLLADDGFRQALDTTWHLIGCIDPDGMRLNEGWFADPGDRIGYARQFYRPAPDEQVEWTFPFAYKDAYFDAMLPETRALARAIDLTVPQLYVPLHNAEAGGTYYYLSRPAPALYPALHEIPAALGVPLAKGEPEAAHYRVLADAVYEMGTLEDVYDFTEALGMDPYPPGSAGDASTSYAMRHGTFSLIAELPQWADPAASDTTPSGVSYAGELRSAGEQLVHAGRTLAGLVADADAQVRLDTPLMRAARVFAPMVEAGGHAHLARADAPASAREATVAERYALADLVRVSRLRFGGMLARALRAEVHTGLASPELRRLSERTDALFTQWCTQAAAEDTARALPLSAVVGVQYGALLASWAQVIGGIAWSQR